MRYPAPVRVTRLVSSLVAVAALAAVVLAARVTPPGRPLVAQEPSTTLRHVDAEPTGPAPSAAHPSVEAAPTMKHEELRCSPEPHIDDSGPVLPLSLAPLFGDTWGLFGSGSLGTPTRGSLFGAVELRSSDDIEHAGGYGWGTASVVRSIERAVREVRRCHPGMPKLYVGDIAREHGGWLRPHRSHQSGLDADLGYYYVGPSTWYQRANAGNLDAPRTWSLMRSLIEEGNVETLFVDISIQRVLKAYVATLPSAQRPTVDPFESPQHRDALIRHAWGHATHFHVRFTDPDAVDLGKSLKKLDPTGEIIKTAPLARR